jgi:hypothetical protein
VDSWPALADLTRRLHRIDDRGGQSGSITLTALSSAVSVAGVRPTCSLSA